MPKFMNLFGYYIYFWSDEGSPLEPVHVHISKDVGPNSTKVWIRSDGIAELKNNKSEIPNKDLKKIVQAITMYSEEIIEMWEEYFKQPATFIDMQEIERD